jgi:ATP-dependent Clp protease, protease subunit
VFGHGHRGGAGRPGLFGAGTAQVLLTAGVPGKRYAFSHARIALTGISRAQSDKEAGSPAEWEREIAKLNAEATGQPIKQVMADCERQREFSAQEAVEYTV